MYSDITRDTLNIIHNFISIYILNIVRNHVNCEQALFFFINNPKRPVLSFIPRLPNILLYILLSLMSLILLIPVLYTITFYNIIVTIMSEFLLCVQ